MNRVLSVALIGLVIITSSALAQGGPPSYRFEAMTHNDTLFSFDGISVDINELEQVVFRAAFLNGSPQPMGDSFNTVIWDNGTLTLVNHPPNSAGSGVYDVTQINNSGQTAGAYTPPDAHKHLHAYKTSRYGSFQELGLLPETHPPDTLFGPCNWAWGHDLNDWDQVVGIMNEGQNFFQRQDHIVIWSGGTPAKVPHPGGVSDAEATYLLPVFINNSGKVAGTNSYLDSRGFFGDASGLTPLPHNIPGVQITEVTGLSQAGHVIGKMLGKLTDPSNGQEYNQEHAFVSINGGDLIDLNESIDADWRVVSQARDVNSAGHIVGAQGFGASMWYKQGNEWAHYRLKGLVTEGDNIPNSFSNALAINEKGVILVSYATGLGATPGLLYPILQAGPIVEFPDTTVKSQVDYLWGRVLDPIDSTERWQKEMGYDSSTSSVDPNDWSEFADSLRPGDLVYVGAVVEVDSTPPGADVKLSEVIYDNGVFSDLQKRLLYPTSDEIEDTLKLLRMIHGLEIDMSVGFEAGIGLQPYITEMFQAANELLAEVTDGMFYIAEANVYNNREHYDTAQFRLSQTNDINLGPLGFSREGDSRTINPLMRYYADNGPGSFEENLEANQNWSPVPFDTDNLERNTAAPLVGAILNQLFEGVAPEWETPDHSMFTPDCPKNFKSLTEEGIDYGFYKSAYWYSGRDRKNANRLSTNSAYSLGYGSLSYSYDCYSCTNRLQRSASRIHTLYDLYPGYYVNAESVPNNGYSPYQAYWRGQTRMNYFQTWTSAGEPLQVGYKDEEDQGLANVRSYIDGPSGGLQRIGRSNLDGWVSYNIEDIADDLLTITGVSGAPFAPSTTADNPKGFILISTDSVNDGSPTYVESILKEVPPALVGVLQPGHPDSSTAKRARVDVSDINVTTELGVSISASNGRFDFQLTGTPILGGYKWEGDVDPGDNIDWDRAFMEIQTDFGPISVSEISAQETVFRAETDSQSGVSKTESADKQILLLAEIIYNFKSPSKAMGDSLSDEPTFIITTSPWYIGGAGLPSDMAQVSANHFVSAMPDYTEEVGVFLRYSDADLEFLGSVYSPEDLRICSRTFDDSLWTVHPTVVDTLARVASTVAEPNRFFTLFAEGLTTDVADGSSGSLPDRYGLSQNYPNPFNPSTTIEFSIPRRSDVKSFGNTNSR